MPTIRIYSAAEQVANHLKQELARGTWIGTMPGGAALARELGVGRMTVDAALELLEKEGLLVAQGPKRRRRIEGSVNPARTKVALVLYEPQDREMPLILELRHQLNRAGHDVVIAPKSLSELKHRPAAVTAMLNSMGAQAHIIQAGSRGILEAVQQLSPPAFALFGRLSGLEIAATGVDSVAAIRHIVRRLDENQFKRIVLLAREENVRPQLDVFERSFLEELEHRGLSSGSYNLAVYENTRDGLFQCLESLFKLTPPDAIIVDDWVYLFAIQNFLARRRGLASRKVVCICLGSHPSFSWLQPGVPHLELDFRAIVRRIVRWTNNVSKGKTDNRRIRFTAKFIENGALERQREDT